MCTNFAMVDIKNLFTCEVNAVWYIMKFGHFMQYYKIIFLSKNSMKNVAWEVVPGSF